MSEELVSALMKTETYGLPKGKVKLIQTHISWVFLVNDMAYKVKKPVNFGFLDFTTLEKRKMFCERELEVNSKLCPEMYLGIVPISKENGKIKVNRNGEAFEYAIMMKRMDQSEVMSNILEKSDVGKHTIELIAEKMADFHKEEIPQEKTDEFGSIKAVRFNWDENFQQTKKMVGNIVPTDDYNEIELKIAGFMEKHAQVFESRIPKTRRCHGDLHSGNIFIHKGAPLIFDAIEFNERFVYSDTASDIAFLAMDLDFRNRHDLSRVLVERYIGATGDIGIADVLDFYKCYRAYVRFKVTAFRLDQKPSDDEKESIIETSRKYFNLALIYSRRL